VHGGVGGRRRALLHPPSRLRARGYRGGGHSRIVAWTPHAFASESGVGVGNPEARTLPCSRPLPSLEPRQFGARFRGREQGGRGTAATHGQGHVQGQLACTKASDKATAGEGGSPPEVSIEDEPPWKEAALTSPRVPGLGSRAAEALQPCTVEAIGKAANQGGLSHSGGPPVTSVKGAGDIARHCEENLPTTKKTLSVPGHQKHARSP
jgi:hypothetical protein